MPPKQFSREEAERLLPRLTELLAEMRARREEFERFSRQVGELSVKVRGNGHALEAEVTAAQAGLERSAAAVKGVAEQVNELGCELKDIDQGLIDFRAEMDGREVYLCWKLGEEAIGWWHELETGFAGRQPLEQA